VTKVPKVVVSLHSIILILVTLAHF